MQNGGRGEKSQLQDWFAQFPATQKQKEGKSGW